jgi:hypothetical protein
MRTTMMTNNPVALTATTATVRYHDRYRCNWLYIIYRTILLLYGSAVAQRICYMWNIYIFSRAIKTPSEKKSLVKKYIYLALGIFVVKRRYRATVRLKPARTHILSGSGPVADGSGAVAFGSGAVAFCCFSRGYTPKTGR